MRVMHISAKPLDMESLEVTAELRCITDALLPGKARGDTHLDVVPQARPSDLKFNLKLSPPDILHYSGHGEVEALELCNEYFEGEKFTGVQLIDTVKGKGVRLVILNCCLSGKIAESLSDELGIVAIGTSTERKIPDEAAVPFFAAFYRGLQIGMPVADAFELAQSESAYSQSLYQMHGESIAKALVFVGSDSGIAEGDGQEPEASEGASKTPQQRMLHSARRLTDIRFGVEKERWTNWRKLLWVVLLAFVTSIVLGWDGWEDTAVKNRLVDFAWLKLDLMALFTFFAFPPAVYLIESYWLRRPLTDAERSALQLAISPPPAEEPESLAERLEALVAEFESAKTDLSGGASGE